MSMRCLRVPAGCPAVERKTRTAPIGGDTPIFPREGMKSPSAQLRLPAVLLRQPREGRTSGIEPTLRSADGWYAIDFLGAGSHPGSRLPGREVGRPSVEVWCSQPAGQVRPVGARHQHRETDRLHRFAGASSDDQTKKTEVIQFPSAARPLDFLGHVDVRRDRAFFGCGAPRINHSLARTPDRPRAQGSTGRPSLGRHTAS